MSSSHVRWFLKKSARKTLALASGVGNVLPGGLLHSGVRVLTYHRFGDALRDPFCVRVEDFDRQMALLGELGVAVSLAQVEAFLSGAGDLIEGAVLVTIDDGCPSVLSHAVPILSRHRIPAVVFVPVGEIMERIEGRDASREHPSDRMTWSEVQEVAQAGITIGSHAWTHESLGRMSLDGARAQAIRSREVLEHRLQQPVTAFAYPYGTRADYSSPIADVLNRAGYSCAFTSQHGAVWAGSDPFTLPRVKIEGGESLWMFRASIRGALDGWRWIDRTMWRVQAGGAAR